MGTGPFLQGTAGSHKPNSLEARALHLALQKLVVLRPESHAGHEDIFHAAAGSEGHDDHLAAWRHKRHLEEEAKLSSDSTGWKLCGSGSTSVQKLTHWHSSVSSARSSMMGAARSESSHVLSGTSVLVPPGIGSDVLMQGTLAVAHVRHILDDHTVTGLHDLLVERWVAAPCIVHHAALGHLLGAELWRGRQVLPVIVAQVVVPHDGRGLVARADKQIHEHGLDPGLARPLVVSTHKEAALPLELEGTRHQRGQWGPTEEGAALQDAGHRKERGGRHLQAQLDGAQQVLSGVTEARDHFGEVLGIRCLPPDDFSQPGAGLEAAEVGTDLLQLLCARAQDDVVGPRALVS